MHTVLTIIVLLVILVILIATHEAGHLAVAKAFNVYCLEYSIGFGPKLFSHKREGGETVFSIRGIPLGGYVSMYGEGVELPDGLVIPESRSLNGITAPRRAAVMLAGIGVNLFTSILFVFIFALCFPDNYMVTSFSTGLDSSSSIISSGDTTTTRVAAYGFWFKGEAGTYAVEDPYSQILYSPAIAYDDNNNQIGFIIDPEATLETTVNGQTVTEEVSAVYLYDSVVNDQALFDTSLLSLYHHKSGYFPTKVSEYVGLTSLPDVPRGKISLKEGDKLTINLSIIPCAENGHAPSSSLFLEYMGIDKETGEKGQRQDPVVVTASINGEGAYDKEDSLSFVHLEHWGSFGDRMKKGCNYFSYFITSIGEGLKSIFTGNINNLGSIVAMGSVIGTSSRQVGWGTTFFFYGGFLALNLAIFNFLPFPGLDGWQLLVTVIEGTTKKKIPEKAKNIVSYIGLALLFGLSIFIIVKDIIGLF